MFEFLQMIEVKLQMDSWTILLDSIFKKLYRGLCEQIGKQDANLEDFKEIFAHVLKKVYVLLAGNRTRPVELLHAQYELLYGLSKGQNKTVLDLLMLNLNDIVGETARLTENPWIDQLWEESIDYLGKLFNDYFPSEVSLPARRK